MHVRLVPSCPVTQRRCTVPVRDLGRWLGSRSGTEEMELGLKDEGKREPRECRGGGGSGNQDVGVHVAMLEAGSLSLGGFLAA